MRSKGKYLTYKNHRKIKNDNLIKSRKKKHNSLKKRRFPLGHNWRVTGPFPRLTKFRSAFVTIGSWCPSGCSKTCTSQICHRRISWEEVGTSAVSVGKAAKSTAGPAAESTAFLLARRTEEVFALRLVILRDHKKLFKKGNCSLGKTNSFSGNKILTFKKKFS